jgi:hypothetical protein
MSKEKPRKVRMYAAARLNARRIERALKRAERRKRRKKKPSAAELVFRYKTRNCPR